MFTYCGFDEGHRQEVAAGVDEQSSVAEAGGVAHVHGRKADLARVSRHMEHVDQLGEGLEAAQHVNKV